MQLATAIIVALLVAPASAIAADVVQPAVPVDRQSPDYPDSAGTAEGTVKLTFRIDADGHVRDASVTDSNPKGIFDAAALAAIANWTYRPRTLNGKPVEQRDNAILLRFKPDEPAPDRAIIFAPTIYYPDAAYLAKAEGRVTVEFDVTADGNTTNVRAVEATSPGVFDQVAVDIVKAVQFEPAPNPDAPPIHMRRTVPFTMDKAKLRARPNKIKSPQYPVQAEEVGVEGICDINLTVRADGSVKDPKIEMCLPKGMFEQASLEAIKDWTFFPVKGPNGPEESSGFYRLSFKLEGVRESDRHYLKPHQWIRLKYTLTETGTVKDVEVVATSEPGMSTRRAVEQLTNTQFAPVIKDGHAISVAGREVRIVGR